MLYECVCRHRRHPTPLEVIIVVWRRIGILLIMSCGSQPWPPLMVDLLITISGNVHLCIFVSISLDDVFAAIKITPCKQCSSDPLPTWLLKDCATLLGPYILCIIDISLLMAHFPSRWKYAIVSPLLRKPVYRRVGSVKLQTSIQPAILSHILERIVHKQMTEYLQQSAAGVPVFLPSSSVNRIRRTQGAFRYCWCYRQGQPRSALPPWPISCFRYCGPRYPAAAADKVIRDLI